MMSSLTCSSSSALLATAGASARQQQPIACALRVTQQQLLQPFAHRAATVRQHPAGRGSVLLVRAAASADASTVRIIIQGRNVQVTDAIKDHVEKKMGNVLSPYENVVKEVDVKLKVHGGDATKGAREQQVEITVYTFRNGVVRVVDKEDSLYAAVDKVADKLSRNLRKLKEKALPKGKWPGHRATTKGGRNIVEVLDTEEVAPLGTPLPGDRTASLPEEVLRSKYFLLEPMSAEEAVEQIQYLAHDFFLFQDKDSGDVRCLYKRHSGGYGIIVPQLKQ